MRVLRTINWCFRTKNIFVLLISTLRLLSSLPVDYYQEKLKQLLNSDKVDTNTKDKLQRYRDLSDHSVRKELQNASNSNSEEQRRAAISTLCKATFRTIDRAVHLKRTLTFLAQKIKNEQILIRTACLQSLIDRDNTV